MSSSGNGRLTARTDIWLNQKRFAAESVWIRLYEEEYAEEEGRRQWLASRSRDRAKIPLGNAMQADLFQKMSSESAKRTLRGMGIDELAETPHCVIPESSPHVVNHALLIAGQIGLEHRDARTKFATFDDTTGDNVL